MTTQLKNTTSPLQAIYECIKYYIQTEITSGILNDVSMFISTSERYDHLDTPLIWLEKQEITTEYITHSNVMHLHVPVSFICCDEIIDTITEAEQSTIHLASRVISTLYKNIIQTRPVSPTVTPVKFRVEKIYPDITPTGSFKIQSKTVMMAAARVDTVFTFKVDWMEYETITTQGENKVIDLITQGEEIQLLYDVELENQDINETAPTTDE